MDRSFYSRNRERLAERLKPGTLAVFFSGEEIRKTNDEYYPFFADRDFVYLTGIEQKQSVLLIMKDGSRILLTGMGGSPYCDEPLSQLAAESAIDLSKADQVILPDGTKLAVPHT